MWDRNRIVGTGLFALDVILGEDSRRLGAALGGSTGNVLSILGALGWTATPVAIFGKDVAGEQICNELEAIGADLRFVDLSIDHKTNVIYQHQLPQSCGATHRFSFICPQCGAKHKPVVDFDSTIAGKALAGQSHTDVFYLDRPTLTGYELAKSYSSSGALVVFEPSTAGNDPELFEAILQCAHIVKYADERFEELSASIPNSVLLEIQTLGPKGLRYRAPSLGREWKTLSAYTLPQLEDTSGAGDWCTAGLVYALLRDGSSKWEELDYVEIEEALVFGQALSSLNCMTRGARGLLQVLRPNEVLNLAASLCSSRAKHQRNSPVSVSVNACGGGQFEKLVNQKARTLDFEGYQAQVCCQLHW